MYFIFKKNKEELNYPSYQVDLVHHPLIIYQILNLKIVFQFMI
jgi:hypothetical protein